MGGGEWVRGDRGTTKIYGGIGNFGVGFARAKPTPKLGGSTRIEGVDRASVGACSQPHGWIEPVCAAMSSTYDCQPHDILLTT